MAAGKSNAPWSVKGIERDARETAKEAAQKEGMTVGAWLNQMIYNAGAPTSSGGVVDGLKLKDVITAIEALNTRVATAENKSAEQIDKLVRNFGGVVERVQRLERGGGGGDAALAQRVAHLEEKSTDRQRIDTLKALEKAVGQVALQFDTAHKESISRLDAQEKQLQQLAGRLEGAEGDPQAANAINYLKNAVDGLAARISRAERIASEASKLNAESTGETVDAEFVERTGARLRVLGDEIKRGGDEIRSLEGSIVKLSSQIDAAEKRSAEGVHKVSETIAELRQQFSSLDTPETDGREQLEAAVAEVQQRTEERITELQNSFEEMVSRLEQSKIASHMPQKPTFSDTASDTGASALLDAPEVETSDDNDVSVFDLDAEANDVGDDEFSIDLDDDFSAEPVEATVEDEDEDILSQVRQAYGDEEAVDPLNEDPLTDPVENTAPPPADKDLDDVLAELEGMGFSEEAPAKVQKEKPAADSFLGDLKLPPQEDEPQVDAEATPEPKLSKPETAKPAAAGLPKTKRELTPKQRAILAARIRRKQQEAKAASSASEAASGKKTRKAGKQPAAALADPSVGTEDDDEIASTSMIGKLGSAFSGIAGRFQRGKTASDEEKKTTDDEVTTSKLDDILSEDDSDADGDDPDITASAKSALRGITSRPVTIALAVSILLAAVALFFIVKDVFLSPPTATPEARIPVTAPAGEAVASEAASTPVAGIREVPTAPTVRPRDLYLESVAALQLAKTPEAEAAAMQQLREAAALGHPPAQLQLGEFYKTGQGVEQDLNQARTWYERAATGGNILAMHRAGVMTAQGEGGPADMAAAIEWFKQAGDRALVDSQYNLGALYHPTSESTEGGVQNAGQAYYWYSLAAKNGDDQAASLAAGLAGSLDANLKSELDASVAAWAPTPADPVANEVSPAS